MNIQINNGRLIGIGQEFDASQSLFVMDGRIAAIGTAPDRFKAEKMIDAGGKIICAGLVDLAARLREPGFEHKATLESEMLAAVAGGVTSLVCPPDTDPVLDEPGLVEMLKRRADALHQTRVYPLGALTLGLKGERLSEMVELTEAGCVGFFNADQPITNTNTLYRALQYAATYAYTVWLRAEESHLANDGIAHDGEVATRLGLAGIPVSAETVMIATITTLMRETGARVHLARLSSRLGVDLVRAAKADGLALTCDVGVHHLLLTDRDIGYFDSQHRFAPPLRSPTDRDALSRGVIDGTIDAICSDHTPHDDDAKNVPFGEALPGATGLELLLPLTLKWAEQASVPLSFALKKISSDPARLLGLSAGSLVVGQPADICVFDPKAFWAVTSQTLRSQGKNSPYLRRELEGRVTHTLVNGKLVFQS
ncbi:MAG: dihydroorotase [Burkholderiales bacterium]|nr:dihydroorotase [Burkholderiales bacterium]